MSRDLRIVWTIDMIPREDLNQEQQAVKIFGIWTHNQINRRLFYKVAEHASRTGVEFVRRRTLGINMREGTLQPLSFELELGTRSGETKEEEMELESSMSEQDFLELHEILVSVFPRRSFSHSIGSLLMTFLLLPIPNIVSFSL